jgi:hypothetical protein
MFGNLFWYKPTTLRLILIFYGNLRLAGTQTIWLLHFMLQMYATQLKTSLLKNNHPTKTSPWWNRSPGLGSRLRCFEPPHARETLRKGLVEVGV